MKQALKDGMGKDPAPVDVELEVVATADEIWQEDSRQRPRSRRRRSLTRAVPSMPSSRIMRSKSKADQKALEVGLVLEAHDAGCWIHRKTT